MKFLSFILPGKIDMCALRSGTKPEALSRHIPSNTASVDDLMSRAPLPKTFPSVSLNASKGAFKLCL